MRAKKGICPVSFLWSGQGVGAWLMRASLATMLAMSAVHLLFITSKRWFWAALGLWALGKAITTAQKRRHT